MMSPVFALAAVTAAVTATLRSMHIEVARFQDNSPVVQAIVELQTSQHGACPIIGPLANKGCAMESADRSSACTCGWLSHCDTKSEGAEMMVYYSPVVVGLCVYSWKVRVMAALVITSSFLLVFFLGCQIWIRALQLPKNKPKQTILPWDLLLSKSGLECSRTDDPATAML
eukprot:GEMP01040261.1.p1 GENE.GEMP01040261.1~~GEMP01040261.1.p1  ORF type:complete len:171 (+),score=25.34 GEMP01040261.1:159-671(+)